MNNSEFKNLIANIKSSTSAFTFAKYSLGLPVSRPGQAICAPAFIRPGDTHPSFAVYENIAVDFSTGNHYDVIDLAALALFNGDKARAIEYLHGSPVWDSQEAKHSFSLSLAKAREKFQQEIQAFHANLKRSHPEAIDYLHSRRISDSTIAKFMLGYHEDYKRIIFPYWKNNAYIYWNGRDMSGRSASDPKYPKYLKCRLDSSPVCENILWGYQTIRTSRPRQLQYEAEDGTKFNTGITDPKDSVLVLAEGMVDALSFAQEGWQVLSPGTCGLSGKQEAEFLEFASRFGKVFVCFDNDERGRQGQLAVARKLLSKGINFTLGHVPSEVCGHDCKDVSDYYTAGGNLDELVNNAPSGLAVLASCITDIRELSAFFRKCARNYDTAALYELREACFEVTEFPKKLIREIYIDAVRPMPEADAAKLVDGKHTLLFDDSGVFYEYSRGVWEEISEYVVHRYAGEALGRRASSGRMRAVANYLKDMHAGRWEFNRKPVFVFTNGTLHLDEQDAGRAFTASSPSDMATISVNYPFSWTAKRPKWDKFINDVTGGNDEAVRLMKQIGGYVLVGDNRFQKIFCLLGDGSNGKSVFMNTLEQVFGSENCSGIQPANLGSSFDPIALKDSLVNFCYEMQNLKDGSAEILKAVASGDAITAAHKGVDAVRFKTRAKFIIAANKMFNANDVSYGFIRRLVFVKFDRQFLGKSANKNLASELLAELPGIFLWCYEGYRDLMKNGGFIDTLAQAEALQDFYEQVSTVRFAMETLPGVTVHAVSESEMYGAYKDWCEQGGFRRLNRVEFMKDMNLITRTKFPDIQIRKDEANACRAFIFTSNAEDENLGEERPQGANRRREAIALGGGSGASPSDTAPSQIQAEAETSEGKDCGNASQGYSEALREVIGREEALIDGLSEYHADTPDAEDENITSLEYFGSADDSPVEQSDANSSSSSSPSNDDADMNASGTQRQAAGDLSKVLFVRESEFGSLYTKYVYTPGQVFTRQEWEILKARADRQLMSPELCRKVNEDYAHAVTGQGHLFDKAPEVGGSKDDEVISCGSIRFVEYDGYIAYRRYNAKEYGSLSLEDYEALHLYLNDHPQAVQYSGGITEKLYELGLLKNTPRDVLKESLVLYKAGRYGQITGRGWYELKKYVLAIQPRNEGDDAEEPEFFKIYAEYALKAPQE